MQIVFGALLAEGCRLVQTTPVGDLVTIYSQSAGNPCFHHCPHYREGQCPSYQRLSQIPANFVDQCLRLVQSHASLYVAWFHLQDSPEIPKEYRNLIPFFLHLLVAKDPLELGTAGLIWEGLRAKYPLGEGLEWEELEQGVVAKLRELRLDDLVRLAA